MSIKIIKDTEPAMDEFYMPGEYEHHDGCIIIWPFRPGSWKKDRTDAETAFSEVIKAISRSEHVYVVAESESEVKRVQKYLQDVSNTEIVMIKSNDSWARDIAPTFVKNKSGKVRAVNWEFNAWGGEYNGLYADWKYDNEFALKIAEYLGIDSYDAAPFVMEGGAVHSDGMGTVMVTEACLLSEGRNPMLSKIEIEEKLKSYLGAEKVIWLPRGIYNDETDEHVDNVCAFIKPGHVVLAWTDNKNDPQYGMSDACLKVLEEAGMTVHKLPVPDYPVCVSEEELKGYEFEEGEDTREAGERLAASYVNFYFSNDAVVVPAFGGENRESDIRAKIILENLCPEREVILVDARAILAGGGNIHCITQQICSGSHERNG